MATAPNQPSRGKAPEKITERILLRIDPRRRTEFLGMLKQLDFVEVESLKKQMKRYVQQAPKDVPLTDDDIQQEINAHRARKRR